MARPATPGLDLSSSPDPEQSKRRRGRRKPGLVVPTVGGLVLASIAGGVGYWLARSPIGRIDDVAAPEGSAAQVTEALASDGGGGTSTSVATTSSTVTIGEDGGTVRVARQRLTANAPPGPVLWGSHDALTVEPGQVIEDNPDGAIRYAVIEGGQIFLRGFVPDQSVADAIVDLSNPLWGAENVFDQHVIDPTVSGDVPVSIYFADAILFDFNSTTIDPQFHWLLDIGAESLKANPDFIITITGRTDSAGPEDVNRQIARARAEAVRDYYVAAGASSDQIVIEARGEIDAEGEDKRSADDRRVEQRLEAGGDDI